VAAVRAAQLGFKTVCVEKMATLGGTCLNVGCIPSKALLQSSEYYELATKSVKEHGIEIQGASLNFAQMMTRKENIVKGLVESVASLLKGNHVERIHGEARFKDAHTVEVKNGNEVQVIRADFIIIATGSESIALPFLPFDENVIVSSTGALSLKKTPKRMLVIGAGVIGLELASVYNRLGAQVTIVEMLDRVTPTMDLAISKQLLQTLKKQGFEFYLSAKVTGATKEKDGVNLAVEYEGKQLKLDGDIVLVSVGRRPYTQGLNLQAAGVTVSPKGFVLIDGNFRTSQSHIFAIGDVIDGPMLAHRASHEGVAVAEIIAGKHPYVNYMAIPNVIYTHPEVAAVGFTESEAREAGLNISIGTAFFRGNARARCSGDIDGFVKIIGDSGSKRLLGMHIIGAHASEMIGEGMIAMQKKATLEDIANAPHAHPTLSETIMEAAQNALNQKK
jgi:dihydrolipoamide dehydrogenase